MATSNVYKPGWRSRRRSRLSLVERAVPRLGRVSAPENKPKSDASSISLKKPTSNISQDVEDDARHETEDSQEPLALQEEAAQHAELSLTALAPRLVPPSSPLPQSSEAAEQGPVEKASFEEKPGSDDEKSGSERSEGMVSEPASIDDAEIELGIDDLVPDGASAPDQGASESSSTDLVPVGDNVPAAETSKPEVGTKVIEGGWNLRDLPAAANARADKETVHLDWDALVSSGVVDPRDRARPLPANMDEIARALVRQALSDQSSWRDRIILVSSARESRAKSMAALNFAFALTTISGHTAVLLDANMDGSGAGRHVGVPVHPGLTTALCDSTVEIDDIAFNTNLDRLTLVSSGAFEDDILDRFASRRMLEVLRSLTKDPDSLLVLDAPPILSSQEAAVLSVIAGQVVLVVEAGRTDENSINQALKRIGDRHNVSLVLSEHAGIAYDEPVVEHPPSNDGLPLPAPRKSTSKRRFRRAIASAVVGMAVGSSALISGDQSPSDPNERANLSAGMSALDRSTLRTNPAAPQISGIDR